ncbi:MAG: glycosyl hydrolase [Saprospiraceae bacterium]
MMNLKTFRIGLVLAGIFCASGALWSQTQPSTAAERLEGFSARKSIQENTWLKDVKPVSIGPSVFSCRVTDVDVNPSDPTEFLVAYASGGLWHTKSNGTRFEPIFDQEASMTIGDIAVDWKSQTIWVGTGESNSSRSSYAGTGVYQSTDMGKTWTYKGLPESHHIARIILHPTDPSTVWVSVLGHLYSPNPERGVYKTIDGGATWEKTLFVNDHSGGIDLCLDPFDPTIIYAATWDRTRAAWDFSGAGTGSDIYKSTDGGSNWTKITGEKRGFPDTEFVGRIGICAGKLNGKTVLYASLDNQTPVKKEEKDEKKGLTKDDLRNISKEDFLALKEEDLTAYLKDNNFPKKYTAKKVRELVQSGKIKPQALVEYLEDANSSLFNADYVGAEVYRSDDGGESWYKTHDNALDGINFTYGYYFSTVYCNPENADQVYLLGFYVVSSEDGGKHWKSINGDNVHVDHHVLWVNPDRPGHLINGNDGGLNISWDNGESWMKANNPPVGQFYAVQVDAAETYNVYGGTQDNGVWVGSSRYRASDSWHQTGRYPYESILGGDGMQIEVDTRDNKIVYTGFQFGNYFRINRESGNRKFITPKHELGERPLRFNWQTPIHLSRHNQDILYIGANKLYRSFNRGDKWEAISNDLTAGGKKGNVPYGTLTSIHESPLRFGLLYTGSDDGMVYRSKDGGGEWKAINAGLPENLWVSRIQASSHEKSRVYLSLNGYRFDDFRAYLYVSEDYGDTWTSIGTNLPAEPINVVLEDPANPQVLYVGTDHGLYVSVDRGKAFHTLSASFPAVAVHDVVLQTAAKELVIGTHGRSIYKVSVEHIQALTPEILAKAIHLFKVEEIDYSSSWGKNPTWGEVRIPTRTIWAYSGEDRSADWTVETEEGTLVQSGTWEMNQGLNSMDYHYELDESKKKNYEKAIRSTQKKGDKPFEMKPAENGKYYLPAGTYVLHVKSGDQSTSTELVVE